jgi:hypothetical protein
MKLVALGCVSPLVLFVKHSTVRAYAAMITTVDNSVVALVGTWNFMLIQMLLDSWESARIH